MQKFGQIAQVSQERSDLMNAKTIAQEFRDIVDAEQELKSADPSASAMSSPKHNVAEMVSAAAPYVRLGGESNRHLSRIRCSTCHFF